MVYFFNLRLGGHLDILQYAHVENMLYQNFPAYCAYAAEGGHLHVIKWLRANYYQWVRPKRFIYFYCVAKNKYKIILLLLLLINF